ncbi:MAG: Stk1 family PASTA domain-containing Ser/Thr kinase [Clostridia bacterium]|nr:Stk1 family PASTA domain-containing Ser/Thr kinase [Clostridia bacterium]
MIGRIFAQRYRLDEFIGKGGMALVFRACDLRTGHDVAVKVLRPEFSKDEEFLERFEREALAASKMSHHNIVNLLDVGEEEGLRYLVIEYVRGRTLKEIILEKGRLPEKVAAQIAIRILSALQHAHDNGIIHRDIKPQNVLINAEGLVKVADFGIARVAGSNTLSKGDSVMGSVHYFSPEQARGEDVTAATDIYSVGVVMYEMLTGRVPFDGDTPVSIAMQHISTPPKPLSQLVPEISPAMERVVLRAMAKDPAARYPDASDMARAIREALEHPQAVPRHENTASHTAAHTTGRGAVRPHSGDTGRVQRQRQLKKMRETLLVIALSVLVLGGLIFGAVEISRNIMNTTEAPYLVGETEENALRIGKEKGLVIEVVRHSDPTTPAGVVMLQSREYQYAMKRGDVLVITVSTGPESQGVPELTGKTLEAARAEAEKYGFSLLVTQQIASDQPLSTVLSQEPAAGETPAEGKIVKVVTSGSVSVPQFTGLTRSQALVLAREAGLINIQTVEHTTTDETKYDRVADQVPKEGERVMYDAQITLAIYVQPTAAPTAEPTEEPAETAAPEGGAQ